MQNIVADLAHLFVTRSMHHNEEKWLVISARLRLNDDVRRLNGGGSVETTVNGETNQQL